MFSEVHEQRLRFEFTNATRVKMSLIYWERELEQPTVPFDVHFLLEVTWKRLPPAPSPPKTKRKFQG